MDKVQADSSPRHRDAGGASRSATTLIRAHRGWRSAFVWSLSVAAIGAGCGGSNSSDPPDAAVPDANNNVPMIDAMPRADAGPPPFFEYPKKVVASDGSAHSLFGFSVAAVENVVVVGTPFYDEVSPTGTITNPVVGAAYVLEPNGEASWAESRRLLGSERATSGMFGYSVAASSDIIAVGAWRLDVGSQIGAVFVYERRNTSWVETAVLEALSGDDQERFGYAVAVSGSTIAVGAPFIEDDETPATPAYVFEKNSDGEWEGTRLVPDDNSRGGLFGYSIAISGDTVVVGAQHDSEKATAAGAAYVFQRNGSSWSQVAKLVDPEGQANDFFGRSVAIDGDTIAVGTEAGGDPSDLNTGEVHVFTRANGTWSLTTSLVPTGASVGDQFGVALALSQNTLLVGAHHEDEVATDAGAAYVFELVDGTWTEISKLVTWEGAPGDFFGSAVALSGTTAFVGARHNDQAGTESGSIYQFERRPSP